MTHTYCPGFCNARARQALDSYNQAFAAWMGAQPEGPGTDGEHLHKWLDSRPAEPAIEWTDGTPIWCARDRASIRRALGEVDRLAAVLDQWADGHRGATSGETIGRRTGPGSPAPLSDLLDTLYSEVTDLEDEWREVRGYLPVRRGTGRGAHNRGTALAFIGQYLDDILASEDHAPFGHRVISWERLLQAMTKADPVVRSRPGRCPRCHLVSVLQTRDDGYTECRDCGRLLSEEEYQRDVVDAADGAVVSDARTVRNIGVTAV